MPNSSNTYDLPQSKNGLIVQDFQLDNIPVSEKSKPEYGKQLAEYMIATTMGSTSSYFWSRNQRWRINRNYSNGRINMAKWQDLFEFNGKINYINLLWMPINITNRIITGLVGRWMGNREKIQVTATDTLSVKQKQEEYEDVEAILLAKKELLALQEQSGLQLVPENTPEDEEELRIWQSQIQRLPEEVLYQLGINDVLSANGFFDVIKEKLLHDGAEVQFYATYTWMDHDGVIHIEGLKPENCFYSYSAFPDFRDTTWRGRITTYKISEIRRKYGVQFGGKLTEEELWNMAQTAKEYQLYDNLTWLTQWNVSYLRPYDEWNVDIVEFEIKTVDSEVSTAITTAENKSTILRNGLPKKKKENHEIVEDTKVNIYRGVYARTTQTMLEWGIKKNMIRPQDPKEIGNAEFSYSFFMPQNYDMTCLAIPEKIQEPVDQMIGVCLKMQQLIAKMRPPGAMINWDALQNIDYGLGDANKTIDVQKLYDQTGTLYYKGRDAEGNPIPVPIIELANAGFAPQMAALIQLYQFHFQVLKDELGEDPNLITQAAQPRVAVQNIETAQLQAQYATDYIYRGYVEIMKETAKKVSCLLHDSVTYGAKVYRNIVNEEDISNRIFNTKIEMLPTNFEIAKFEAAVADIVKSNPDAVLFINQFELVRVAKEDVKLAEMILRRAQKKMLQHRAAEAQKNQEATFNAQISSAITAEEEKRKTEQEIGNIEIQKLRTQGETTNKNTLLASIMKMYETGIPIPAELRPVANAVIQNIAVPTIIQNQQMQQEIIAQIEEAAQANQQPEGELTQQQELQQQPQIAA